MIGIFVRMFVELLSEAGEGSDPNYVRNKYGKRRPGGATKARPKSAFKKKS